MVQLMMDTLEPYLLRYHPFQRNKNSTQYIDSFYVCDLYSYETYLFMTIILYRYINGKTSYGSKTPV